MKTRTVGIGLMVIVGMGAAGIMFLNPFKVAEQSAQETARKTAAITAVNVVAQDKQERDAIKAILAEFASDTAPYPPLPSQAIRAGAHWDARLDHIMRNQERIIELEVENGDRLVRLLCWYTANRDRECSHER